ncbi:hypothetical protein MLD38_004821 [Melastoma candidum]|uniref:Uncharacterized protein n=1 Tax=Melastoma candidum TaxID=119954 RepID=A0ACB9S8G1_9MYRT|nr:hypothetical protein MLD38_004821 [Melastoma candidum]
MVKFLQAIFINRDIDMFDEDSGVPAHARTSNLNEELGQLELAYGLRSSEVELAAAKQIAIDLEEQGQEISSTLDWGRNRNNAEPMHQRLSLKKL